MGVPLHFAFAVDDLAVIHTFASMAGRTQGQSLAAQPVIGKLCALARVTSVGNLSSAARIEQGLVEGGSLHGIPGQNIEVHRLRGRLHLHGRGTAVLSRQAVQERTQAVQSLQGKTRQPAGWRAGRARARGNGDHLFRLRQGNNSPFPADAGSPRLLQGMLPVPKIRRGRRRLISGAADLLSGSTGGNGGRPESLAADFSV